MGHLHHLLRHHQRRGLHPALLGGRQREHPQAWLLRPLPLLCGQRAGGPRAHVPRLVHRLQHHPVRRLQGGRFLRAALHGADPRLHHLLCAFLLLQHGHRLQNLRLDAALGSSVPRAGLHDLPRRLGRRDYPGHVRGQDREVLPGGLFRALGVHPGHHRHPQRPHPLLPRLRAGEPANRPAAGGAQTGEQRFCGHHGKLCVAAGERSLRMGSPPVSCPSLAGTLKARITSPGMDLPQPVCFLPSHPSVKLGGKTLHVLPAWGLQALKRLEPGCSLWGVACGRREGLTLLFPQLT